MPRRRLDRGPKPPTNVQELLAAVRRGQDPVEAIAMFAKHLKALEDAAWSNRVEWLNRSGDGANREASLQLGKVDAFCVVLGDQELLSRDLRMLRVAGVDGL